MLTGLSKLFLPLPGGIGKSAERGVEAAEVDDVLPEDADDEAERDDESGILVDAKVGGAEFGL